MDLFLKRTIRSIIINAVSLCIMGVMLFWIERALVGADVAMQQLPCILIVSTLLFALGLVGNMIYLSLVRQGGKHAMSYYLAIKIIRFMLIAGVLVVYAVAIKTNLLVFALNIWTLYLVAMVTSSFHCAGIERNIQKK